MSHYNKVKDWMTKFGQQCPTTITVPELATRKLRAKLILEEALETIKALGFELYREADDVHIDADHIYFEELHEPNIVEIADGLADLHYVAFCGTAIACGISEEKMNAIFDEVHRSNMSKLWMQSEIDDRFPTVEDARSFTFAKQDLAQRKQWLVTNSNGKVIKSPSYSPANLKPILEC